MVAGVAETLYLVFGSRGRARRVVPVKVDGSGLGRAMLSGRMVAQEIKSGEETLLGVLREAEGSVTVESAEALLREQVLWQSAGFEADPIVPEVGSVPGFDVLIAKEPVSNAEVARFMAYGGYRERRYWSEAGWGWKEAEKIWAPLHWAEDRDFAGSQGKPDRETAVRRFLSARAILSYYELEAYASWLGEKTGKYYRAPSLAEYRAAVLGALALHASVCAYTWVMMQDQDVKGRREVMRPIPYRVEHRAVRVKKFGREDLTIIKATPALFAVSEGGKCVAFQPTVTEDVSKPSELSSTAWSLLRQAMQTRRWDECQPDDRFDNIFSCLVEAPS